MKCSKYIPMSVAIMSTPHASMPMGTTLKKVASGVYNMMSCRNNGMSSAPMRNGLLNRLVLSSSLMVMMRT